MSPRLRHVAGTTIVAIVVLAAAACGEDAKEPPSALGLPTRSRRSDAGSDAASNVLAPADGAAADTGPPPDLFCYEPDLVLCFPFEDAVENRVATTPKLAPSQVDGVTFASGKTKRAAHFETASVISFAPSPLLEMQAATVEAWVNRDLLSFGNDTVFDDDARFAMTIENDGTLRCNTAGLNARGGNVDVETWVHVACVFDGATIKAYVSGNEVASIAGTIGTSTTTGAAIGDSAPNGGDGFTGEIDSLRVFKVARSAAQISAAAVP